MRWPFQKVDPLDSEFVIVGGRAHPLRDIYDFLLRAPVAGRSLRDRHGLFSSSTLSSAWATERREGWWG